MNEKQLLEAPAFVIHLESLVERRNFFSKNIADAGYTNMQIFKGVDARVPSEYNAALGTFGNPLVSFEPSKGSIGCVLSHLTLLKHIMDHNIEIATIFEDDVHFHPDFKNLFKTYLTKTPSDWDVLFIGNGLDSCRTVPNNTPIVTTESCFCTHAYVVTLRGAKKLLNTILNWRYDTFNHPSHKVQGLYIIDVMIKHTQNLINANVIPRTFTWYCWNGTVYPCKHNKLPLVGNDVRNSGLVFQATDDFGSTVFLN
jgi:GR25 family glycosyltransferase involved in LPS biosynthesis